MLGVYLSLAQTVRLDRPQFQPLSGSLLGIRHENPSNTAICREKGHYFHEFRRAVGSWSTGQSPRHKQGVGADHYYYLNIKRTYSNHLVSRPALVETVAPDRTVPHHMPYPSTDIDAPLIQNYPMLTSTNLVSGYFQWTFPNNLHWTISAISGDVHIFTFCRCCRCCKASSIVPSRWRAEYVSNLCP